MDDERLELVRVDATGTAHPVGKRASQRLRARQGAFRLMPAPAHLIVMRYVGEDGRRDDADGPVFRLSGEITAPGANGWARCSTATAPSPRSRSRRRRAP